MACIINTFICSQYFLTVTRVKKYSGEFFKEKVQKLAIENEAFKTANQYLQQETESSKNETHKYENENINLENENEILINENTNYERETELLKSQIQNLEQEATKSAIEMKSVKNAIAKLRQETEKCSSKQLESISLEPIGSILISLIRRNEDAQEIDICIGMSTDLGYFTAKSCCQANQKYLFDAITHEELAFAENSIWMEENICLINTTEISKISVPSLKFEGKQSCSVDVFDGEHFKEHRLDMEINHCFNSSCSSTIDVNVFQNQSILNGTSISCRKSNHFGIITKSELLKIMLVQFSP